MFFCENKMSDEVEQDNSDLKGGFRWANLWSVIFFSLDCFVMVVSLAIYMCLLRAVAKNKHKEWKNENIIKFMSQLFVFKYSGNPNIKQF